MRSVKLLIVGIGLLIGFPSIMWGQVNKIKTGDKIRITSSVFSPSYRTTGRMIDVSNNRLKFVHGDSTMELALSAISKLEVSTGKPIGKGAVIGAASLGFLFGVGALMAQGNSCDHSEEFCIDFSPTFDESLTLVALGVVIGAGTGALIASFSTTDRWEEVSLQISPANISMSSYIPGLSFKLEL